MNSQAQNQLAALYQRLLDRWNKRNALEYASLFEEGANVIGFDGSQVNGRSEVEEHLSQILADHMTASYVGKIREIR